MRTFKVTAAAAAVTATAAIWQFWPSEMSILADDLLGTWHKSSTTGCAARYPSVVTLEVSGIYRAPNGVAEGAIWHGGDWELRDGNSIALQLANDRMELYKITEVTAKEVRLVDLDGCEVAFTRL